MKINRKKIRDYSVSLFWATLSIAAGVAVIVVLDSLLGVELEFFKGMQTFDGIWILGLIVIPIISGFVVSMIYGLGGKIIAHFPPLIVKSYIYFNLTPETIPIAAEVLPLGFWVLIVIVVVEAGAAGGLIGEIMIKRTYGRRPKHMIHKRYLEKASKTS